MNLQGVSLIFLWVIAVIFFIYIMEFIFKRQMRVARSLKPVLVLSVTREKKNLERELKQTYFRLEDLVSRGIYTNVIVLCTLEGESKKIVQRVCRHRNLVMVESAEELTNYIATQK